MTLTQAATWTKRLIILTIISIVLGTSGAVGYQIWHQRYLASLPPVEEKPEMKFGALPTPAFLPFPVASSNFSYSVDTVTGGFPDLPKLIKIYFIPRAGVSLLAPQRSKQLAETLGFLSEPDAISATEYKFFDGNGGELLIDLATGNFRLQRGSKTASATASASPSPSLPDQTQIVQLFKGYLTSKNLLPDELKDGRSNIVFESGTPANPETAEVSIWTSDVDGIPIATSIYKHGLVKATITKNGGENEHFSKIDYTFWLIDTTTFSTYPLKTPDQAFADLKNGQGYVAIEPKEQKISISSVSLAYFQSEEYSPYLLPVFVFEGPNFSALVPAVNPNYTP